MKSQKQELSLQLATQNILISRLVFFREIIWHHTFLPVSWTLCYVKLTNTEKKNWASNSTEEAEEEEEVQSIHKASIIITDLDFADDLALKSEEIEQAQMVL